MDDAPWLFRWRAPIIGVVFFVGFFVGFGVHGLAFPTWRAPLYLGAILCAIGIAWRVWGASYLGAAVVFDTSIVTRKLYTGGPYRYTRNPLYLGLELYAVGIATIGPPITVAIVAVGIVALDRGLIAQEEPRLRARFGGAFDAYVKAVPRVFPSIVPRVKDDGVRPSLRVGLRGETIVIAIAIVSFAFAAYARAHVS